MKIGKILEDKIIAWTKTNITCSFGFYIGDDNEVVSSTDFKRAFDYSVNRVKPYFITATIENEFSEEMGGYVMFANNTHAIFILDDLLYSALAFFLNPLEHMARREEHESLFWNSGSSVTYTPQYGGRTLLKLDSLWDLGSLTPKTHKLTDTLVFNTKALATQMYENAFLFFEVYKKLVKDCTPNFNENIMKALNADIARYTQQFEELELYKDKLQLPGNVGF